MQLVDGRPPNRAVNRQLRPTGGTMSVPFSMRFRSEFTLKQQVVGIYLFDQRFAAICFPSAAIRAR
jgi:hypothetical protein